jgi:hypothetical protein
MSRASLVHSIPKPEHANDRSARTGTLQLHAGVEYRLGGLERFSEVDLAPRSGRSVTRSGRLEKLMLGFPLNRWDPPLAQPPGSQPGREVPDDHRCPIHSPCHDPARLY